ncbi:MAG: hypothetical protein H8D92_01950 [Pelagibacteraceae bacterium]|jgi:hypothetical protein|nr:hypothetical protein [Pelagibacteraceae bacterium]
MAEEEFKPNWTEIKDLADKIDVALDEKIKDNKLSFMEIDMSLVLVQEKLAQEKHKVYAKWVESEEKTDKKINDIYR